MMTLRVRGFRQLSSPGKKYSIFSIGSPESTQLQLCHVLLRVSFICGALYTFEGLLERYSQSYLQFTQVRRAKQKNQGMLPYLPLPCKLLES